MRSSFDPVRGSAKNTGMKQQTLGQLGSIRPGPSRFRLRVTSCSNQLRPYGWEIRDEERDACVRRSNSYFRTSHEAWEDGSKILASLGTVAPMTRSSVDFGNHDTLCTACPALQ